ncbi:MAG: 4-hydroxy-3-methylbut-2-enyl diphosphate reductase [Flavobacteriales bacterium]|nr:4-hydroxy-3-methylbut-2-enyl diphosphate reductase [Flavobacteriales bacterium]|tara:strand:- start:1433 stop:2308 length:876 start_codon:yes stop_codon:yes gene_type:complete
MNIEIDKYSGFCFGVVYAIEMAEEELKKNNNLYCLGDIVHNNKEVERLNNLGLKIINHEELKNYKNCKVLIRAHGEPPETYKIAMENNIELLDASCPVVLKLQNQIKEGYKTVKDIDGQIVVYGKKGHAEIIGLLGQIQGDAILVSSIEDLDHLDFSKPIFMYSQTTKSPKAYSEIKKEIEKRRKKLGIVDPLQFVVNDTLCRQVSGREPQLKRFSEKHDVIVFVSGTKSSNGKMLYESCKDENPNSYFISDVDEIKKEWFSSAQSVGICGATSTPLWLMEDVSKFISEIN